MAMIDQKTPHLLLPLPNSANQLADDVERIRTSFGKIDTAVKTVEQQAAAQQTTLDGHTASLTTQGETLATVQATAGSALTAAQAAQSTADTAGGTAATALGKAEEALANMTKALSAPVISVASQVAIGYPATVALQDGAVKLCATASYQLTVNGAAPVSIPANEGAATYSVTPSGQAGDTLTLRAVAVDALGNTSTAQTATATLVDVSFAAAVITSPANGEANVALSPAVQLSAMTVLGGVADTAATVRVQVATDAAFEAVVFDSNEASAATTVSVTTPLARKTTYYVRARWTGTQFGVGPWSAAVSFETLDAQVVGVCQLTDGTAGQTFQRIDISGNALPTAPTFSSHPIYAGITEHVIDGQRMIRFPKCFVKRETLAAGAFVGKDARCLSDVALPGYDVHPAFLAKDGSTVLDQLWIGKYQASAEGSTKAASVPGVTPLVSIDFPTMQTRCTARNTGGVSGFHLWNVHEWSLVQLMMLRLILLQRLRFRLMYLPALTVS